MDYPRGRFGSLFIAILLASSRALAATEEDPGADAAAEPRSADDDAASGDDERPGKYSHFLQFGLRASMVAGYRMILRYTDSPLCTEPDFEKSLDDQQQFCGHLGPAMLDLSASFAPLPGVEPFLMARLGLVGESPTDTEPLRIIAAGTRIYMGPKKAVKFFLEPSLGVEFEGGGGDPDWTFRGAFEPQYKSDVIFRIGMGPQFELARNVGLYAQVFGLSVGVLRYLHATMEFGAGVQARFP